MNAKKKSLLFVINSAAFFISHRLPIAIAAKEAGYDVHVATPLGSAVDEIKAHGFEFHTLSLSRSGKNILRELMSIWAIYYLFLKVKPDLVHLVTIKPVLYGAIAARLARIRGVVAAISGLGFVFVATDLKSKLIKAIVTMLYKFALSQKRLQVIFQNKDDSRVLLALKVLQPEKCSLIRGSGVDLSVYHVVAEKTDIPVVVMAARLLKDKGVWEFVEAVTELSKSQLRAKFVLAGDLDLGNPSSLTTDDLNKIKNLGFIEVKGYCKNIPELFSDAHIVVLPSYREGLPKVLIEAAACGRAVVTTDVPGCRDAIEANQTGLLVPVRNSHKLAQAIKELVAHPDLRKNMGIAGRQLAEQEFDVRSVVDKHLHIYEGLLQEESN